MQSEVAKKPISVLEPKWAKGADSAILSLEVSGESLIIAAVEDGRVILQNQETGDVIWEILAHNGSTLQASISPSGLYLASAGEDGFLKIWDIKLKTLIFSELISKSWADHLMWAPEDDFVIAAAGKICIGYNAIAKTTIRYDPLPSTISCLDWLHNQRFGLGCYGSLRLYSKDKIHARKSFKWQGSLISLKFSPDRKYAVCGAQDLSIHIWNLKTGQDLSMSGFQSKSKQLSFHCSSERMVNAAGNELTIWDFRGQGPQGKEPVILGPLQNPVQALAFQNKGDLFYSCDKAGAIVIWSPFKSNFPVAIAGVRDHSINCATWSKDDRVLFTGLQAGHVVAYRIPDDE